MIRKSHAALSERAWESTFLENKQNKVLFIIEKETKHTIVCYKHFSFENNHFHQSFLSSLCIRCACFYGKLTTHEAFSALKKNQCCWYANARGFLTSKYWISQNSCGINVLRCIEPWQHLGKSTVQKKAGKLVLSSVCLTVYRKLPVKPHLQRNVIYWRAPLL